MNSDAQASTPELPMLDLPPSPQFRRWSQDLSAQNGTRLSSFMHLPTNQFDQKRSRPPYLHAGYHDMLLICTC
jgi:hypothetical protein